MRIDLRNGYSDTMCPRPLKWHDRDSLHSTQICPYRDVQGSESVWLLPCQSYWLKSHQISALELTELISTPNVTVVIFHQVFGGPDLGKPRGTNLASNVVSTAPLFIRRMLEYPFSRGWPSAGIRTKSTFSTPKLEEAIPMTESRHLVPSCTQIANATRASRWKIWSLCTIASDTRGIG